MMVKITINTNGAITLLELLEAIELGNPVSKTQISNCLKLNTFFVDYYSSTRKGVTFKRLVRVLKDLSFHNPAIRKRIIPALHRTILQQQLNRNQALARLRDGFLQALPCIADLRLRMQNTAKIDFSESIRRTAAGLPSGTQLHISIHFTIDGINEGFAHKTGMGLSLLRQYTKEEIISIVSHELHHLGFRFWVNRDAKRRKVLSERSKRSVAIQLVQNLIMEGMAVYFCSPDIFNLYSPEQYPEERVKAYREKITGFKRDEDALLKTAEETLRLCLSSSSDTEDCRRSAAAIERDDKECLQPSGHYIGARMIEIMAKRHSHEKIVDCIANITSFLPLYNEAALSTGNHVFDDAVVNAFSSILE